MRRFNEFTIQRQLLAVLGTLPVFGWITVLLGNMIATSVVYPLTQKYRQSARLEEREGYSLVSLQPAITAEIAMQAGSHSEALLRGKEQLNGYTEGGNSRLKEVETVNPTTVKKVSASEAADQDPLILLSDRFNKDPHQGLYVISYTLSSGYSRSLLGKPNNPYIKLREKDREMVAVRHFNGYPTPRKIRKEEEIFKKILERDGYVYDNMYVAEYSPPWVFYWLRHNELVVPLKRDSSL